MRIEEKPPMLEKEISKNVKGEATNLGYLINSTFLSKWSPRGFPDLTLCRPPRLIFAELKGPKGKLAPKQRQWLDWLSEIPGVEVYLWREENLEAVYRILFARTQADFADIHGKEQGRWLDIRNTV